MKLYTDQGTLNAEHDDREGIKAILSAHGHPAGTTFKLTFFTLVKV